MKIKQFILALSLYTPFFAPPTLQSMDDFDNDVFLEDDDLDQFDSSGWEPTLREGCITPEEVILILVNEPILAQERLKNNFYFFVNPPNSRSLLDSIQNLLHLWCLPCTKWQWYVSLFYNQTTKVNFTKNGTTIDTYLDLNNAGLLQKLEEIEFGIDIPTAIELFSAFKLQERRAGFMLGGAWFKCNWYFECKAPLYYLERNFFVTEEEKSAIEKFLNPEAIPVEDEEIEKQIRRRAICDHFGLGDTRFNVGRLVIDNCEMMLLVGGVLTIPTASTLASGLMGTNFQKDSDHPAFNLLELFQLGLCDVKDIEKIKEITIAFGISAYDKLAANLLQTNLGNNGHLGIGAFLEKHLKISRKFSFKTRAEFEYLLPAWEKRFYITKKFPAAFDDAFRHYEDPNKAINNINFLNQQLINTVIPKVYDTLVWPGLILKFDTAVCGKIGKNWEIALGFDLYWQEKERLGDIDATPSELFNIRKDNAIKPGAYQNKLFGSVNYTKKGKCYDWCISFYGDGTLVQYGVGKDFNLCFNLAMNY